MKKILPLILFAILLASCAQGVSYTVDCVDCHVYGFWGGLWHGIIAWFDFVWMLIWDDVVVYAPNNNGTWYALGFVIGACGLPITISKSAKRMR